MRLEGKVAIVTGASRSIGAEVAKAYAREGAKVVINDRSNVELAEQVVEEIKAGGGEAFVYAADVSKQEEVQAMVDETVRRYGAIDILVNNAGIDPRRSWEEITVEDWDQVMGVNVRSQFLCAKAVSPFMQEKGSGSIINVSSVTFFTGQKNFVHYVASKGAVVGFTRALARELGSYGINVNCITPGAIYTDSEVEKIGQEASDAAGEILAKSQCITRRGVASDLIGAFVLLASEEGSFITGQTLNIDGGWVLH